MKPFAVAGVPARANRWRKRVESWPRSEGALLHEPRWQSAAICRCRWGRANKSGAASAGRNCRPTRLEHLELRSTPNVAQAKAGIGPESAVLAWAARSKLFPHKELESRNSQGLKLYSFYEVWQ